MTSDLHLRRKLTLRAHGRQIVLVKRRLESIEHVLMKAFIWAMYLPEHPDLSVEVPIGDRYKPDVVQIDPQTGKPVFWGEAGKVGAPKIASLARRFRETHFVIGKWNADLSPYAHIVREAADDVTRTRPIDLIRFPADAAERFITDRGEVTIIPDALQRIRIA